MDREDLEGSEVVILDAMEAAHDAGLLFGGNPIEIDPSGWTKSTFPNVAARIAAALAPMRVYQFTSADALIRRLGGTR